MLQIIAVQDKSEQKSFCEICDIEYDADIFAYAAYADGKFFALAQFAVRGKTGYIYDIKSVPGVNDRFSLLLLCRAAISFLGECGVIDIYYEQSDRDGGRIAKFYGFKETPSGKWHIEAGKSCDGCDGCSHC